MKQTSGMPFILLAVVALLLESPALPVLRAAPVPGATASIDAQLRELVPPPVARLLLDPQDLRVRYVTADLDKTGTHDYIVAAYVAPVSGGKLRVFKTLAGQLQLAGEVGDGNVLELDDSARIKLVYVDNSGIPAVEVESLSTDGANQAMDLFRWTGRALVSMSGGNGFANAYFADPEGTGVPQIVEPPFCAPPRPCGYFSVYTLKNDRYDLAATSTIDPSGLTAPAGEYLPSPRRLVVEPGVFGITEIRATASAAAPRGDVLVRLGDLSGVRDDQARTDVTQVDPASVYVGRNIRPSRVRIRDAAEGRQEGFDGAFLELTVPRLAVLQYLSTADPTSALAPGEMISLPVHARLKNGLAVNGSAAISIAGPAGR